MKIIRVSKKGPNKMGPVKTSIRAAIPRGTTQRAGKTGQVASNSSIVGMSGTYSRGGSNSPKRKAKKMY